MVPALGEEYGFAADATNLGSNFFDEDFGDVDVDHEDDDDLDDDVYDVSALNEDDDDDDMDDTAAFFESADECDDEYGDDGIDDMLYDMYAGEPTGCRCQFIVNHRVKDLQSTINKVFRQNRDLSSVMCSPYGSSSCPSSAALPPPPRLLSLTTPTMRTTKRSTEQSTASQQSPQGARSSRMP